MSNLTLYGRTNCAHCEQLKFALDLLNNRRQAEQLLPYQYVDVDTDAALQDNYGLRVPVLVYGAKVICEGVFDIETLEQDVVSALGATK